MPSGGTAARGTSAGTSGGTPFALPGSGTIRAAYRAHSAASASVSLRVRTAIAHSSAQAVGRQSGEISGPPPVLLHTEFMQIIPGEYPGVMTVVEHQPHGVMADRLDRADTDVPLAAQDGFLPRTVALELGGGA